MNADVTPFPTNPGAALEQDTLEALLERVALADAAAFSALYDRICGPVFGIARRVVRDPSHAEEVTQEVMLEIWRHASRYNPERGSAVTWMLTIAHRRAVDRVRSVRAATERDERSAAADPTPAYDQVYEEVSNRLEQQQVRKALSSLTDLQRDAIQLAYYEGHTQQEVADLLRIPLGTAKTRLRDGLIRLRDAMGVTA